MFPRNDEGIKLQSLSDFSDFSNDWRLIHISKTHLVFFDGEKTMIEPLEGIEDRENVFFKVNGKNYMEM